MAVVSELALAKVPVPLEVHNTLAWLFAPDPAVTFTEGTLAHIVTAVPAFAVGAALITTDAVGVMAAQPFAAAIV